MSLLATGVLEFQQEPTRKNDILKRTPWIHGSEFTAITQMENLRNRYYATAADQGIVPSQARHIARTNPPVKAATAPVTLSATGFGRTYALTDEALRQYSLGTYLQNMRTTYYQTRP